MAARKRLPDDEHGQLWIEEEKVTRILRRFSSRY